MEMCMESNFDLSYEEQEAAVIEAGYTVKEFTF